MTTEQLLITVNALQTLMIFVLALLIRPRR